MYVGNLAPEVSSQLFKELLFINTETAPDSCQFLQVTQLDLHRLFHTLGAGVIEEVRVQRDKGFGFVRYNTHDEAALAIQMGNSQPFLFNRQIKVLTNLCL